eukprot:gene6195-11599_t
MTSASKVAEIFEAAGLAFTRLGTMAMELQSLPGEGGSSNEEGKWGEEEIEMLRQAILRFGNDLQKISTQVKTKSVTQIRAALKQKAMQQKVGLGKSGTAGLEQGLIQDSSQTPIKAGFDDQGRIGSKRLRLDDSSSVMVSNSQDNLLLGSSTFVNNSSMIGSALDKLKYESKDSHSEIDIEG